MNKIAVRKAIAAAGGATDCARLLSERLGRVIARDRVQKWKTRGVPARFVLPLEAVSGVPRHELAPDLYPEPQTRAA